MLWPVKSFVFLKMVAYILYFDINNEGGSQVIQHDDKLEWKGCSDAFSSYFIFCILKIVLLEWISRRLDNFDM